MLKILAPAKINLVLEVIGKRLDGYHEIRTIMHTIDFCDEVFIEEYPELTLRCDQTSLSHSENIVMSAARRLKEYSRYKGGAFIKLEKKIPISSGLGGGSSDAAATLLGLNRLWKLKLSLESLNQIAIKLGSDVPFFIKGGIALVEGKGEKITELPEVEDLWMVILIPDIKVADGKTALMYSKLARNNFTNGQYVNSALEYLRNHNQFNAELMYNAFDSIALEAFEKLDMYFKAFESVGADNIHIAGSGPTLFSLVNDKSRAKKLMDILSTDFNFSVYIVKSLSKKTR